MRSLFPLRFSLFGTDSRWIRRTSVVVVARTWFVREENQRKHEKTSRILFSIFFPSQRKERGALFFFFAPPALPLLVLARRYRFSLSLSTPSLDSHLFFFASSHRSLSLSCTKTNESKSRSREHFKKKGSIQRKTKNGDVARRFLFSGACSRRSSSALLLPSSPPPRGRGPYQRPMGRRDQLAPHPRALVGGREARRGDRRRVFCLLFFSFFTCFHFFPSLSFFLPRFTLFPSVNL